MSNKDDLYDSSECMCTLAQRLVGDGCYICNPGYMDEEVYLLDEDDLEFMKEREATGV